MSTNYYWNSAPKSIKWISPLGEAVEVHVDRDHPAMHICQYAHCRMPGETRLGRYAWAQEPELVLAYCVAHLDETVIVSEYGTPYMGREFAKEVNGVPWDRSMLGKSFS